MTSMRTFSGSKAPNPASGRKAAVGRVSLHRTPRPSELLAPEASHDAVDGGADCSNVSGGESMLRSSSSPFSGHELRCTSRWNSSPRMSLGGK